MASNRQKGKPRGDNPGKKKQKKVAPKNGGASEGIRRRDRGIERVVKKRKPDVLADQIGLLAAIRRKREATIDDARPAKALAAKCSHRGIRGSAVLGLAASKVIVATGERRPSRRKWRNGGKNSVWTARDWNALAVIIRRLRAELRALLKGVRK